MDPIEITYRYGGARYGWYASSYHLLHSRNENVAGADSTYEATQARVEDALRWSLEDESLEFEHYVEASAIPQYLAEREIAERAAAGKATAGAKP
jgi:hypothetical protein